MSNKSLDLHFQHTQRERIAAIASVCGPLCDRSIDQFDRSAGIGSFTHTHTDILLPGLRPLSASCQAVLRIYTSINIHTMWVESTRWVFEIHFKLSQLLNAKLNTHDVYLIFACWGGVAWGIAAVWVWVTAEWVSSEWVCALNVLSQLGDCVVTKRQSLKLRLLSRRPRISDGKLSIGRSQIEFQALNIH